MAVRLLVLGLLAALLMGSPAKKTVGTARGENEELVLEATIYVDPADVKEVLGDDLGGHYIVAEVKVEPKYGKEISIDRDDFVLRTDKDGEKAKPSDLKKCWATTWAGTTSWRKSRWNRSTAKRSRSTATTSCYAPTKTAKKPNRPI